MIYAWIITFLVHVNCRLGFSVNKAMDPRQVTASVLTHSHVMCIKGWTQHGSKFNDSIICKYVIRALSHCFFCI